MRRAQPLAKGYVILGWVRNNGVPSIVFVVPFLKFEFGVLVGVLFFSKLEFVIVGAGARTVVVTLTPVGSAQDLLAAKIAVTHGSFLDSVSNDRFTYTLDELISFSVITPGSRHPVILTASGPSDHRR